MLRSVLTERVLPLVSITLALVVLLVLIAVSTSPLGELFRSTDARSQYLHEAAVVLDQQLGGPAVSLEGIQADAVERLASTLPTRARELHDQLIALETPGSGLAWTRQLATTAFNLADPVPFTPHGEDRYRPLVLSLQAATGRVHGHIDDFLANRGEYLTGAARFERDVRSLVQQLRSSGRDDSADQLFRAGNQILDYAHSGEASRLDQISVVQERMQLTTALLSDSEQAGGRELVEMVPVLVDARRAMNQSLQQMDLAGLATAVTTLREQTTSDRLRALAMISDARVLLNLYTVFLLVMLGYLGLRLRSSYAALNRSHDELEARVQERTADLELAYDELKESQVQLVQAEKMSSLGQLVAGVMHEINTPLLYALNNTSVTTEAVGELTEYVEATVPLLEARCTDEVKVALKKLMAQRERFDTANIRESAGEVASLNQDTIEGLNQISDLVQSLKDFSRLDRATEDRFNVCEGVEKTLTITRNLLKYGIEVVKDFESVDDIYCSPARINQIFVNLVTNAAQAMDGKGTLTIAVRDLGDYVEVSFQDTGCGIAEENLQKIMDPFFTTKPVGEGTGLGLSIVHQIVQQHNGHLDVQSEVGQGTRIAVQLPKHPYTDEEAA